MPNPADPNDQEVISVLRAIFPHFSEEQLLLAQREIERFLNEAYDLLVRKGSGDGLDKEGGSASLN